MSVYLSMFVKELETLACFIRARTFLEILKLISKLLTVPELLRQKLKPSKTFILPFSNGKPQNFIRANYQRVFCYFLYRSFIFPEH